MHRMELKEHIARSIHHIKTLTNDPALRSAIQAIPKYELHVHLAGAIRRKTLVDLATKNNIGLPAAKKHFLQAPTLLDFSTGSKAWELFHTIYKWCWSCIKSCEDLERIVIEFLEDSHAQGVVHSEFTVSGSYITRAFPFDEWTDAIASGINIARKNTPIVAGAILDISRRFGAENALKNVEQILKSRPTAICGIGMGGDEVKYPHHLFKDAFALALENNIGSTVHVSEFTPGETTIEAINELKPQRLGHALNTIRSEEAYKTLKGSNLHVESCPLCNYVARMGGVDELYKHPVKRYFDDGIPISINTDDPRIFGFDLIDNYICLMRELGFSIEDFETINRRTSDFVFVKNP